jgi:hypothetical protein
MVMDVEEEFLPLRVEGKEVRVADDNETFVSRESVSVERGRMGRGKGTNRLGTGESDVKPLAFRYETECEAAVVFQILSVGADGRDDDDTVMSEREQKETKRREREAKSQFLLKS